MDLPTATALASRNTYLDGRIPPYEIYVPSSGLFVPVPPNFAIIPHFYPSSDAGNADTFWSSDANALLPLPHGTFPVEIVTRKICVDTPVARIHWADHPRDGLVPYTTRTWLMRRTLAPSV